METIKDLECADVSNLCLEWDNLNISQAIKSIIKNDFEFSQLTPVQAATIPLMLSRKDVIVESNTGSGKTVAFLVPILETILHKDATSFNKHDVLALIVSPTRELATQIFSQLRVFTKKLVLDNGEHLVGQLMVGGTSTKNDLMKYETYGANILVVTPGRMSDLLDRPGSRLLASIKKKFEILILDEADQLLSLGFDTCLTSILCHLPKQRRTGLFSATQTQQLLDLIRSGLRNPIRVDMSRFGRGHIPEIVYGDSKRRTMVMPQLLNNYYHFCENYDGKIELILNLLTSQIGQSKIIVFMSTCAQVDYFNELILGSNILGKSYPENYVLKLHRKLRNKRKAIFSKFRSMSTGVLLATDVISRGIDIPNISWVIHMDLPSDVQSYVHRSGRSAHQVNMTGSSLLLLEDFEQDYITMCKRKNISLRLFQEDQFPLTRKLEKHILIRTMQQRARQDENFYELGMQAFVSYIRFYSSKMCLKDLLFPKLNISQLAKSFGLIKVPKMPELRQKMRQILNEFDADQDDLLVARAHAAKLHPKPSEEIAAKFDLKTDRKNLRSKQIARHNELSQDERILEETSRRREKLKKLKGKKQKRAVDQFEFDELRNDARMVKKLKKGKVSDSEFEKYFGL